MGAVHLRETLVPPARPGRSRIPEVRRVSVLDDIVAGVRDDLAARESRTTLTELRAALADVDPPRGSDARLPVSRDERDRRGEAAQPEQG